MPRHPPYALGNLCLYGLHHRVVQATACFVVCYLRRSGPDRQIWPLIGTLCWSKPTKDLILVVLLLSMLSAFTSLRQRTWLLAGGASRIRTDDPLLAKQML